MATDLRASELLSGLEQIFPYILYKLELVKVGTAWQCERSKVFRAMSSKVEV